MVEGLGAAVAISALLWGVYTARRGWRENVAVRRAEYVRGYTNDFYESKSLPMTFLEIDSGRYRFDDSDFGTEREVEIAHLLDFLNTVGMAVVQGIVSADDLRQTTIGYAVLKTWRDQAVQRFLSKIDGDDSAEALGTVAFGYFRLVGKAMDEGRAVQRTSMGHHPRRH